MILHENSCHLIVKPQPHETTNGDRKKCTLNGRLCQNLFSRLSTDDHWNPPPCLQSYTNDEQDPCYDTLKESVDDYSTLSQGIPYSVHSTPCGSFSNNELHCGVNFVVAKTNLHETSYKILDRSTFSSADVGFLRESRRTSPSPKLTVPLRTTPCENDACCVSYFPPAMGDDAWDMQPPAPKLHELIYPNQGDPPEKGKSFVKTHSQDSNRQEHLCLSNSLHHPANVLTQFTEETPLGRRSSLNLPFFSSSPFSSSPHSCFEEKQDSDRALCKELVTVWDTHRYTSGPVDASETLLLNEEQEAQEDTSSSALFLSLTSMKPSTTFSRRSRALTSPAMSNPLTQNFFNDLNLHNVLQEDLCEHLNADDRRIQNRKSSCYQDDPPMSGLDGFVQPFNFLDSHYHESSSSDDKHHLDDLLNSAIVLSDTLYTEELPIHPSGTLLNEDRFMFPTSKSSCVPDNDLGHSNDTPNFLESPGCSGIKSFNPYPTVFSDTHPSSYLDDSSKEYLIQSPLRLQVSNARRKGHERIAFHPHELMNILSPDNSNFAPNAMASELLAYKSAQTMDILSPPSPPKAPCSPKSSAAVLLQGHCQDFQLHMEKKCKPCAFFYNPKKTCRNGSGCLFCHHHDHALLAIKQWKKLILKPSRSSAIE